MDATAGAAGGENVEQDNLDKLLESIAKAQEDPQAAIAKALGVLFECAQVDGAHHKAWTLDQVTRALTGDSYEKFILTYCFNGLDVNDPEKLEKYKLIASGDYYDGDFTVEEVSEVENSYYDWDKGIAP